MTKKFSRREIERQARERYVSVYGREPSIDAEDDHGSATYREKLESHVESRMEQCRLEVRARHERLADIDEARERDEVKAELRRRFLALPGGTVVEFESQYQQLLAAWQREQVARQEREHEAQVVASRRSPAYRV